MQFWLGTHCPDWLGRLDVPLMIHNGRLRHRRTLPRARGPWALDSGAFSELTLHGQFTTTPRQYTHLVRRYANEIGSLKWAAPQDWMCEPMMLAKTGLTVAEHQQRTIASYLHLRMLDDTLPWIPVIQGWTVTQRCQHVDGYARVGIRLETLPLVGLGSVCKLQSTDQIHAIVKALQPLRLHGFGVKVEGLASASWGLTGADSLAWSYQARRRKIRLRGCVHPRSGKTCANCPRYALWWRQRVLAACTGVEQLTFPLGEVAA